MEAIATVEDGLVIAPSTSGGMFEIEVNGEVHRSETATIHEIPENPLSNLLGTGEPQELLHRIFEDPSEVGQYALMDCEIRLHFKGSDEPIVGRNTFIERSPEY